MTAASKNKTVFVCQACGTQSPKWQGRCTACNEWNSLVEERAPRQGRSRSKTGVQQPQAPQTIDHLAQGQIERLPVSIQEFSRVLGGGCVPGSVILLGGDPGIGKSTLILQALDALGSGMQKVLYVSGEESAQQIHMRAERLSCKAKNLWVLTETSLETVFSTLDKNPMDILCLDSVQTLYSEELEASPGSISQVRHVAARLVEFAKRSNCVVFLIGHVTKDGSLAGPRVLEHMVDTVLYFEANHGHPYRILRTTKNRYGSTNEIGVFEMTAKGLQEVQNPSQLFLSERTQDAPGSAVTVALEGTRPILIELQSLTQNCHGGPPRRTCLGTDANRVSLLAAVIQREMNIILNDQDLYLNVVGGMKINEPAADLGIIASVCSSRLNLPIQRGAVFFGEVGLTGEVRAIQQPAIRIQEAAKLGFQLCVLPRANTKRLAKEMKKIDNIDVLGIHHIQELLPLLRKHPKPPQRTLTATA